MMTRIALFILTLFALAACDNVATGQQTLVAFDEDMEERRSVLAATSTANMEILLLTLDFSEVQLTRVRVQQDDLIATLQAAGVAVQLPAIAPAATATPVAMFNAPNAPQDPNVEPTEIQITPFAPTLPPTLPPPPTVAQDFPDNLRQIVLAPDVGADDCATQVVTSFSTQAERVYIVARAFGIASGTEIASVWERDGEPLARFAFTPDFAINDACIWFFADPTDFDFIPGNYAVTLQISGAQAAPTVNFPIQEG